MMIRDHVTPEQRLNPYPTRASLPVAGLIITVIVLWAVFKGWLI